MSKLETYAERKFVKKLREDFGLRAIKFTDPARRGAPDRFVPLPDGRTLFVEFKREGEKRRREQIAYGAYLESLGHTVLVCYDWQKPYSRVETVAFLYSKI